MSDLTIHVIDDDDAAREGLVFLLTSSNFIVQGYPSGRAFFGWHSRRAQRLRDYRSEHARPEWH